MLSMSENVSTVSPLETMDSEQLRALLHVSMRILKRWRRTGEGSPFMVGMRTAPHQRDGKRKAGHGVIYRLLILLTTRESLAFAVVNGAIPSNPARDIKPP